MQQHTCRSLTLEVQSWAHSTLETEQSQPVSWSLRKGQGLKAQRLRASGSGSSHGLRTGSLHFPGFVLFFNAYLFMCECVCVHVHTRASDQRTTCKSRFSLSTTWVPGIKLHCQACWPQEPLFWASSPVPYCLTNISFALGPPRRVHYLYLSCLVTVLQAGSVCLICVFNDLTHED